jgi:hypothetical protein
MHCPFCHRVLTDQLRGWYFDLELCRPCSAGQVALPLKGRTQSLTIDYTPPERQGDQDHPAKIVAIGQEDEAQTLTVTVYRRQWWSVVLELAFGRLQTGDDAFDANVYIRSKDPSGALALLRLDAARASVLDCIASGSVHVAGGRVTPPRRIL